METIKKLHNNEKYVGIASGGYTDEIIKHWAEFNPDMLTSGADFDFIRDGSLKNFATLKKLFKDK